MAIQNGAGREPVAKVVITLYADDGIHIDGPPGRTLFLGMLEGAKHVFLKGYAEQQKKAAERPDIVIAQEGDLPPHR